MNRCPDCGRTPRWVGPYLLCLYLGCSRLVVREAGGRVIPRRSPQAPPLSNRPF